MASWTNDPQTDRDVEMIVSGWERAAEILGADITDRRGREWSIGDRTSRHPGDGTLDMGTVTGTTPDEDDPDYVVLDVTYDSGFQHSWSAYRWPDAR